MYKRQEIPVPELPVGHHSDDCHPDNAIQGLPQAYHHLLLYPDDFCRSGSSDEMCIRDRFHALHQRFQPAF